MDRSARHASGAPFGARLRAAREAAGLTQEALAEMAGLSVNGISALERGLHQHPYPATVRALSEALTLTTDDRAALVASVPRRGRSADAFGGPLPLPAPLSQLVGREGEVATITAMLRQADARLVTLIGPGGVGKTRLALQVAVELQSDFADGAAFVALGAVRDPALVAATIADALRLRDAGGQSFDERLQDALRNRHLLLVVDNFEQVLGAAPLLIDLLAGCPRLAVLATSRATLHLTGEHDVPVAPLPLPDPDVLAAPALLVESAAVQLFAERARAVDPAFALSADNAAAVAAICLRLEGLPLAIELAAARCGLLTVGELLPRLARRLPLLTGGRRDAPARHQTMRTAIAWSYDLLDPAEQALFRRLAVFAGGFTVEAEEAVTWDHPALLPFDGIVSLMEKSLLYRLDVVAGATRVGMLETIRELGLEKLVESGEETKARDVHLAYVLALADRAALAMRGPEQAAWLDRLGAEHANLREALAWAVARRAAEPALRLTAALVRFWTGRGYLSEGRRWANEALAISGKARAALRTEVLIGAAGFAISQDDYVCAVQLLEEALMAARSGGDERGEAGALEGLGVVARYRGDAERAEAILNDALGLRRRLGDAEGVGATLNHLANLAFDQAALPRAVALYTEALAVFRQTEEVGAVAKVLSNLGLVAMRQDEPDRATAFLTEAEAIHRALGDEQGVAFVRLHRGWAAVLREEWEEAAAQNRSALSLFWALGVRREVVEVLDNLAYVASRQGKPGHAVDMMAAAARMRVELGISIAPVDQEIYAEVVNGLRTALGSTAFDARWEEGRFRSPAAVVALALTDGDPPTPGRPTGPLSAGASDLGHSLREREAETA